MERDRCFTGEVHTKFRFIDRIARRSSGVPRGFWLIR
jgi:hypothetical protein